MDRLKNESYLSYIKRITDLLECKSIGYKEWGNYILGADNPYSSDNCRKAYYFISKMLPTLEDISEFTNNDILKMIQIEKQELYKDKVKARDQRRELNKSLTGEARFENLVNVMKDAIDDLPPLSLKSESYTDKNIQGLEAVLMISDIHYGIGIDNRFNFYNTEVAKERLNELKNKTIHYCIKNNVTKLNIELLGDLVSGILHTSVRVQQEEDIITQIMELSELLSNIISELHKTIPNIVVYSVFGNHSRVIGNKKDSLNRENYERLIPFYLKSRLNNKIKIFDGREDDFLEYKINGESIVLIHGDKDTPNNALDNIVRILGIVPKQIHLAHRHHLSLKDDCNTDIIANGSIVGTDEYALSVRKVTNPSQTLIIFDRDICICKLSLE